MENQEMKFADGMGFKTRHEKAPETVRGTIYFNVSKFTQFLQDNKDDRGWVNTKMMKSKKDGSIYFILDTWKPNKEALIEATSPVESTSDQERINATSGARLTAKDATAIDYPEEVINLDDIPF